MFICGVRTLNVCNRVVGTETGKGIDVAVRIVTCQIAMIEPKDTLCMEVSQQALFNLLARARRIAIGRKQTRRGGKDGAPTVTLYATALENKIEMRRIMPM